MKTLIKSNTLFMTILSICLALLIIIGSNLTGNSGQEDAEEFKISIPELLDRNVTLKQTAEWESHVNAVSDLRARLIEDPRDMDAIVALCQIYCIEARVTGEHGYYFPAILTMLDHVLESQDLERKTLSAATALKSNVLLSQHRWGDGLEWAERAHALNPYSPQAFAALIDAHVELGNYKRAVELTDELMAIRPGLMAYARVSYLRQLHGDLHGAIDAMELAVESGYPGFENTEWCRIQLGELYEEIGESAKAQNIYRMSMQYRDENPFAKAALARTFVAEARYSDGERLLIEALGQVPEIGFQEELFKLYKAWEKPEKATQAYNDVIVMVEDDLANGHIVNLDYANILFELGGEIDRALDLALRAYEVRPDNIQLNTLLSKIYLEKGQADLARQHLLRAQTTGYSSDEIAGLKQALS